MTASESDKIHSGTAKSIPSRLSERQDLPVSRATTGKLAPDWSTLSSVIFSVQRFPVCFNRAPIAYIYNHEITGNGQNHAGSARQPV